MGFTYSALVEMWALYVMGSLIIFLRVACRWRMVGVRNFKMDDYIIWFSWVVYTIMSVAADVCGRHGSLHTLSDEVRATITEAEAAPYVWVTKWFCTGVSTYIVFIWSLKFTMLFFYKRVVNGLWVEKFIMPAMALVVASFVAVMVIQFASCRPYNRMWQIYPDQGARCMPLAEIYLIPALVLNVVTDIFILAIPAPVIFPVKTTVWRKISLIVIFSAGLFIMVAAILRVDFVLVQDDGTTAAIWSCREDFVAIIVGQAPIRPRRTPGVTLTTTKLVRPAFTRRFWTGEMSQTSSAQRTKSSFPIQSCNDAFEMGTSKKGLGSAHQSSMHRSAIRRPEYNVTIQATSGRNSDSDSTDRIISGGIVVDTWVDVESESICHEASAKSQNPYDRC
ncbi:hypothetical protein VSDG_03063 [Cytospora chrysosperma]|uniref:Rhodopsin domain-containing protein n=1 Tax=Cytospora chrysosperma TaxID=252740 RepID=A0A423W924_CYTCH|nr:hypothetical protein VSDG_03063 [Valsa sordida]